jgi:hypothetical protein
MAGIAVRGTASLSFAYDPAIHGFASEREKQDVDHRDKPGDDDWLRGCVVTQSQ